MFNNWHIGCISEWIKNSKGGKHLTKNKIHKLSTYHKYWIDVDDKENIKNPQFDEFSNLILARKLKDPKAIDYFYKNLNDLFPEKVAICTVPSSNPENIETGITLLAEKLSADKNRIDRTHFLKRTIEIPKLASGGDRRRYIHLMAVTSWLHPAFALIALLCWFQTHLNAPPSMF